MLTDQWHKSTRSHTNGCVEARWVKAAASQLNGCVEVAVFVSHVAVRNSTDPDGLVLLFTPHEWTCFLDGVKREEFEVPAEAVPR